MSAERLVVFIIELSVVWVQKLIELAVAVKMIRIDYKRVFLISGIHCIWFFVFIQGLTG